MLGRECVPERDRVPSLQYYGYPLEQEHGLLLPLVTSGILLPTSGIIIIIVIIIVIIL